MVRIMKCRQISLKIFSAMDEIRSFIVSRHRGRHTSHCKFRSEAHFRRFVVRHAQLLLDVNVIASEYPINFNGGGRIDALGIDSTGNPVVIEFKRSANGTATCQGLCYLDWLERHRDIFSVLVLERLGQRVAARIRWVSPRIICLAEEIGEREEAVARQIGRAVDLLQLRRLPGGLILVQRPPSRLHSDRSPA